MSAAVACDSTIKNGRFSWAEIYRELKGPPEQLSLKQGHCLPEFVSQVKDQNSAERIVSGARRNWHVKQVMKGFDWKHYVDQSSV